MASPCDAASELGRVPKPADVTCPTCKMAGMEGTGMGPAPEGSRRGYTLAVGSFVLAHAEHSVNTSFAVVLVFTAHGGGMG